MIIYVYRCESCNHTLEIEQSIKDDPITECPKCSERSLKRLISGGQGFILKGQGWFRDGYSSGDSNAG